MTSRKAKITAKKAQRGSPRPTTRLKSALGAPISAITWENIEAKMMISMTIEVVRMVARKASRSARHVSVRKSAARTRLTNEPRAAASVGGRGAGGGVGVPGRPPGGRGGEEQRGRVAAPPLLGARDPPVGGGGGHAGPGEGGEDRAGDRAAPPQSPRQEPNPARHRREES